MYPVIETERNLLHEELPAGLRGRVFGDGYFASREAWEKALEDGTGSPQVRINMRRTGPAQVELSKVTTFLRLKWDRMRVGRVTHVTRTRVIRNLTGPAAWAAIYLASVKGSCATQAELDEWIRDAVGEDRVTPEDELLYGMFPYFTLGCQLTPACFVQEGGAIRYIGEVHTS